MRPTSSSTAFACSWLTVAGSKPVRAASASPACGPLPVTTVPSTSTTAVTPTTARTSQVSSRPRRSRRGPSAGRAARQASVTVTAMIPMETRKCAATVHGFSPVSTVIPPTTPWAGMPRKATMASVRSDRRRCSSTAISVASATRPTTYASIRLPNSISPCSAYAAVGVNESSVHRGQVGQPSPESVSRTVPPVTTIAVLATTDATASRRTSLADAEGSGTTPA